VGAGYVIKSGVCGGLSAMVDENFDFGHAHFIMKNWIHIKQRNTQTLSGQYNIIGDIESGMQQYLMGGDSLLLMEWIELGF
jgi:hypothetical protein